MLNSKLILFFCVCLMSFSSLASIHESRLMAAMRLIGHETLLNSGDSTSRVLPVIHKDNIYTISFESDFTINPSDLAVSSFKALDESDLSKQFVVEIISCDKDEVVYSFEFGNDEEVSDLPCRTRAIPVDCYQIKVIILDSQEYDAGQINSNTPPPSEENNASSYLFFIILLPIALSFAFLWNKKKQVDTHDHLISIGSYRYDQRNMTLTHNNSTVELTGKESDLLFLLYDNANQTLERDLILQKVWGDEGDYVGRTLDVFISKLRKKLDETDQVKIVNIRGVGYKMVVNH